MSSFKSQVRGWIGEKATQAGIFFSLDSKIYKAFHDVIIRSGNGTTQIDHIIVSKYGIFVIETKNYSGWIFGSEDNAKWTQMMGRGKKKYSFQNPLRQNYKHTKSLSKYLGLNHDVMHSIVFFVGECKLKTKMPKNVMTSGVSDYIHGFSRVIIDPDQLKSVVIKINEALNDPRLNAEAHVEFLKSKHSSGEPKQNPKARKPKKYFVDIKKTFCVNSSCDYKGSLKRTKKGRILVRNGFLILWIAVIAGLIEIMNADSNTLFVLFILLFIGKFGHTTAIDGSKHLQCPKCRDPNIRQPKNDKETLDSPAPIPKKIPKIRTNIYVLVDNQTQGPYTEDQVLEMVESGSINDETQICPEGSQQWITFKTFCEFM